WPLRVDVALVGIVIQEKFTALDPLIRNEPLSLVLRVFEPYLLIADEILDLGRLVYLLAFPERDGPVQCDLHLLTGQMAGFLHGLDAAGKAGLLSIEVHALFPVDRQLARACQGGAVKALVAR